MAKGNGRNGQPEEATASKIRERLNISYATINHYTNLGLFLVVKRSGNKRIYSLSEVEIRYGLISKLANEGYPLCLIRKKLTEEINDGLL